MDFLFLILAIAVGFVWGYTFREKVAIRKTQLLLKMFEEEVEKEEKQSVIKIKIEKEKDTFYVYDFSTNKFITQANTRDELEDNLAKIFPGKKFGCTKENLIEIGFIS
jgi:hypothetical protein